MRDKGSFKELFSNGKADPDPELPNGDEPEVDVGPCASVPRGKWVTALEIRHAGKPWEAFQYKDISTRSEYEPGRFVVVFEGREERYRVVVKGRNLGSIYATCIQGRLEWIQAVLPARDVAADGEPVILSAEVVVEKVKG